MSKEVDERIRHASNRTARDAARLIFKAGERKEDKLSKLQAELNRRRKEVWSASVDRMRALLPKAFDVIERAIDEGSYQAALALIKLAGLDGVAGEIGADDAKEIIKEQKKAALWEDIL